MDYLQSGRLRLCCLLKVPAPEPGALGAKELGRKKQRVSLSAR